MQIDCDPFGHDCCCLCWKSVDSVTHFTQKMIGDLSVIFFGERASTGGESVLLLSCRKMKLGKLEGVWLEYGGVAVSGSIMTISGLSCLDCGSGVAYVTISVRVLGVLFLV